MPPDANGANILKPQLTTNDFASIAMPRHCVGKGVKSVSRLESWPIAFLSRFNIREKTTPCLIKPPESLLSRSKIHSGVKLIELSLSLKPGGLLCVGPINPSCVPAEPTSTQYFIVEPSMCLKANRQLAILVCIRKKPKLKNFYHLIHDLKSCLNLRINLCMNNTHVAALRQ